MRNRLNETLAAIDRRQALTMLGGLGASVIIGGSAASVPALAQSAFDCVLSPALTEGPYFVDEKLNRSDIRIDPTTGSVRPGTPLTLTFNIYTVGSSCGPLAGAYVDVWHADASGNYSDVGGTSGQKWLRGYQTTDSNGAVRFTTIYPGWYMGRAVHIHFKIRTYSGSQPVGTFTSQFFFNESVTDTVYTRTPYSARPNRDTRNANDGIYRDAGSNVSRVLVSPTAAGDGYAATLNVGVNIAGGTVIDTSASILPQLAFGGGWQTSLLFANTNDAASSVQVNFLSTGGQALLVPASGLGSVSSSTLAIAGRATTALQLTNSGSGTQGWAEAVMPSGVMGYALYRWAVAGRDDQEALVPFTSQTSSSGLFVFDETSGITAFAFANPSTQAGVITVTSYQAEGSAIGSATVAVEARSRMVGFLRNLNGLGGMAGTRGYATLAASNGVLCALALRFVSSGFTSIPIVYR